MLSEKTYKICDSCGWGRNMPLPDETTSNAKKIPWCVIIWETILDLAKSVTLAIAIWIGVIALTLMIIFATCSILLK